MAIDSSIYFQSRTPDIAGGLERGLTLRDMIDRKSRSDKMASEEEAVKAAYKAGVVAGPDGTPTVDRNATLSGLAKASPERFMEAQKQFKSEDAQSALDQIQRQKQKVQQMGALLGSANDQATWSLVLHQGAQMGLDVSQVPRAFDERIKRMYQLQSVDAAKQLDEAQRAIQNKFEQQKIDIQKREAAAKKSGGEQLPLDKKKVVETLSTKNAGKIAIKNQIDAVMGNWDRLSEDQKVAAGRQLLKTLNSTEGADAIGSEEAKRLGSKLEFALGNLFNSNPVQFGRDLKGFKEQADNTSRGIGEAVKANQNEIDNQMGRRVDPRGPEKEFSQNSKPSWAR